MRVNIAFKDVVTSLLKLLYQHALGGLLSKTATGKTKLFSVL